MAPTDSARPIALVTGASRGIGRAIALELGSTHHILVGGRDAAAVVPWWRRCPRPSRSSPS